MGLCSYHSYGKRYASRCVTEKPCRLNGFTNNESYQDYLPDLLCDPEIDVPTVRPIQVPPVDVTKRNR